MAGSRPKIPRRNGEPGTVHRVEDAGGRLQTAMQQEDPELARGLEGEIQPEGIQEPKLDGDPAPPDFFSELTGGPGDGRAALR